MRQIRRAGLLGLLSLLLILFFWALAFGVSDLILRLINTKSLWLYVNSIYCTVK